MEFKDYYQTLSVPRAATAAEIKKAYRKLARKYHPDVSKEADAEKRMAEVNEAYAVLGDEARRKTYDEIGAEAWAHGARSAADMRPPPNWNAAGAGAGGPSAGDFRTRHGGEERDFSEFFEQMFGRGASARGARASGPQRGADQHAQIELRLLDAYHGTEREITLRGVRSDAEGRIVPEERTLHVKIPKGVGEGQLIRLAGHGEPGFNGGAAGDLLLEVRFQADARWQIDGRDVTQRLRLAPWEAALGGAIRVATPAGSEIEVTVPAGSGNGRKLRLKGRGIPARQAPGDLYLLLEIAMPGAVTAEQKAAWAGLAGAYPGFNPRSA